MVSSAYDASQWKQLIATVDSHGPLRIAYIDCQPPPGRVQKGIIVLLHGFPQTSYQFRAVITPLADAGFRTIAPDYRGAGASSKPASGFTKSVMSMDIVKLLDFLGIGEAIHLVGHDIGGMIAYAFASRHPHRVASVMWGECPLPGTAVYEANRTTHAVQQFHFAFHSVLDLPEALVAGRERIYLTHFFTKLAYNAAAISATDLDHYVDMYSQPGAMRCAFQVYRFFETDSEENRAWLRNNGKCNVPTMALSGESSRHRAEAQEMFLEVCNQQHLSFAVVKGTGHYLAEDNPVGFVEVVLEFVNRHVNNRSQSD